MTCLNAVHEGAEYNGYLSDGCSMKQAKSTTRDKNVQTNTAPREVEYVPPPDEQIDEYVRSLCESLAQQDPAYRDFEVRSGLSSYLKLLAKVATQKMNALAESTPAQGKPEEPTALAQAAKKVKASKINASVQATQPECKPEEPTT